MRLREVHDSRNIEDRRRSGDGGGKTGAGGIPETGDVGKVPDGAQRAAEQRVRRFVTGGRSGDATVCDTLRAGNP